MSSKGILDDSPALDKNANPKIPRHISRQYVFGARGFRREQREALRRTLAALDDLLLGSVYIPGGNEPLRAFQKYLLAVKRQMPRKEWGG